MVKKPAARPRTRPKTSDSEDALRQDQGTKAHILAVAERVFGELGYAKATTRRIAQEAGIAPGLLFYYFQTKKDLYAAVVHSALGELAQVVMREAEAGLTPTEAIRRFVGWYLAFSVAHRHLVAIMAREMIDGGDLVREISAKYGRPILSRAQQFIRKGVEEGYFQPVSPDQFILDFFGAAAVSFTGGPIIMAVTGVNPLDERALGERRKSLLRLLDKILIANP